MDLGWSLNFIGLVMTTIAAILMYLYPMESSRFTPDGGKIFEWYNNGKDDEEKAQNKKKYEKYKRKSKLGVPLLAIGFGLQALSALLAVTYHGNIN